MFAVDIKPPEAKGETQSRIFIRENDRTIQIEDTPLKENLLFFPPYKEGDQQIMRTHLSTPYRSRQQAESVLQQIQSSPALALQQFTIHETQEQNRHHIIRMTGPIVKKTALPPGVFQMHNEVHYAELMRWLAGFPFPEVDIVQQDGRHVRFTGKRASWQEICAQKKVAIDTESMFWERQYRIGELDKYRRGADVPDLQVADSAIRTFLRSHVPELGNTRTTLLEQLEQHLVLHGKEHITTLPFITMHEFGNYCLTTFDTGADTMTVPSAGVTIDCKVIHCPDTHALIMETAKLIESFDPLHIMGHNIMGFDLPKIIEVTNSKKTRLAAFGVDGSIPVQKFGTDHDRYYDIAGRCVLDTVNIAKYFQPETIDNKLVTVFERTSGVVGGKEMNYGELTTKSLEALLGNKKSAKEIVFYAISDTIKHFLLGERYLPLQIQSALMNRVEPSGASYSSPKNNAAKLWRGVDFVTQRNYRKQDPHLHSDYRKETLGVERATSLAQVLRKDGQPWKYDKGYFPETSLIYVTPMIHALRDVLDRQMHARERLAFASTCPEPLRAGALIELEEANLEIPFLNLHERISEEEFKHRYGIAHDKQHYLQRLHDAYHTIAEQLGTVINVSPKFVLAAGTPTIDPELGQVIAHGPAFSLDLGRFCMRDTNLLAQGMDVKGRKGERAIYHRTLVPALYHCILDGDQQQAHQMLLDHSAALRARKLPREDLVFLREQARKDYDDYSSMALDHAFVRAMVMLKSQEGGDYSFAYGIQEGIPKTVPAYSLLQGCEPDWLRYLALDFGPKGRLLPISLASYPSKKKARMAEFRGQRTLWD